MRQKPRDEHQLGESKQASSYQSEVPSRHAFTTLHEAKVQGHSMHGTPNDQETSPSDQNKFSHTRDKQVNEKSERNAGDSTHYDAHATLSHEWLRTATFFDIKLPGPPGGRSRPAGGVVISGSDEEVNQSLSNLSPRQATYLVANEQEFEDWDSEDSRQSGKSTSTIFHWKAEDALRSQSPSGSRASPASPVPPSVRTSPPSSNHNEFRLLPVDPARKSSQDSTFLLEPIYLNAKSSNHTSCVSATPSSVWEKEEVVAPLSPTGLHKHTTTKQDKNLKSGAACHFTGATRILSRSDHDVHDICSEETDLNDGPIYWESTALGAQLGRSYFLEPTPLELIVQGASEGSVLLNLLRVRQAIASTFNSFCGKEHVSDSTATDGALTAHDIAVTDLVDISSRPPSQRRNDDDSVTLVKFNISHIPTIPADRSVAGKNHENDGINLRQYLEVAVADGRMLEAFQSFGFLSARPIDRKSADFIPEPADNQKKIPMHRQSSPQSSKPESLISQPQPTHIDSAGKSSFSIARPHFFTAAPIHSTIDFPIQPDPRSKDGIPVVSIDLSSPSDAISVNNQTSAPEIPPPLPERDEWLTDTEDEEEDQLEQQKQSALTYHPEVAQGNNRADTRLHVHKEFELDDRKEECGIREDQDAESKHREIDEEEKQVVTSASDSFASIDQDDNLPRLRNAATHQKATAWQSTRDFRGTQTINTSRDSWLEEMRKARELAEREMIAMTNRLLIGSRKVEETDENMSQKENFDETAELLSGSGSFPKTLPSPQLPALSRHGSPHSSPSKSAVQTDTGDGKQGEIVLEIRIQCRDLLQMDWCSVVRPMVACYRRDPATGKFHWVGQTETRDDELSPTFDCPIYLRLNAHSRSADLGGHKMHSSISQEKLLFRVFDVRSKLCVERDLLGQTLVPIPPSLWDSSFDYTSNSSSSHRDTAVECVWHGIQQVWPLVNCTELILNDQLAQEHSSLLAKFRCILPANVSSMLETHEGTEIPIELELSVGCERIPRDLRSFGFKEV